LDYDESKIGEKGYICDIHIPVVKRNNWLWCNI